MAKCLCGKKAAIVWRVGLGKLTPHEINEIRHLREQGLKLQEIADQFGRGHSAISEIVNGNTYRWV